MGNCKKQFKRKYDGRKFRRDWLDVITLLHEIPRKTVYWKTEDVRDTDIPEVGIRRSHSYNAYLIGCLLHIAGEPKTFEEILEILKK
jgi:hypothetical protein